MAFIPPTGGVASNPSPFGTGAFASNSGSVFRQLQGKAPNANISPVQVERPDRADYGTPGAAPTITDPNKGDYGLDPADKLANQRALTSAGGIANKAQWGFNNPTKTGAFANLMNLAGETTGAAQQAAALHAKDAAQRRGYAGGFEDTARQSSIDKMNALAMAGGTAAESIRKDEGDMYGKAIGAFTALQSSYNEAQASGNTAFAHDLTSTHIQNAENQLKNMDLNQQQQAHYGDALNQAKQLQAQLNEQFNKDKIDNNRFIQGNAQIAAQLAATMATLAEHRREFDIGTQQSARDFAEKQREFDTSLAADPRTALRAVPGQSFRTMIA